MNRRKFFTLSASIAPAIFVPKLINIRWKRSPSDLLVIPEWMQDDIEQFNRLPFYLARNQIQIVANDAWSKIADETLFNPGTTQYKLCQALTT